MFVSRVLADWCIGSAPLASASTRPEHPHATDKALLLICLQGEGATQDLTLGKSTPLQEAMCIS